MGGPVGPTPDLRGLTLVIYFIPMEIDFKSALHEKTMNLGRCRSFASEIPGKRWKI